MRSLPPELTELIALLSLDDDDDDFCASNPLQKLTLVNKDWSTNETKLKLLKELANRSKFDDDQHMYVYNRLVPNASFAPNTNDWKQWHQYLSWWCRKSLVTEAEFTVINTTLLSSAFASMIDLSTMDSENPSFPSLRSFVDRTLTFHGPMKTWRFAPSTLGWYIEYDGAQSSYGYNWYSANRSVYDKWNAHLTQTNQNNMRLDDIDQHFLTALVQWRGTENIRALRLQFDAGYDKGGRTNWDVFMSGFARPSFLSGLKQLRLERCRINNNHMATLAKYFASGRLASLETLVLRENNIGNSGVQHFAEACLVTGTLSSLWYLSIDDNNIDEEGMDYLMPVFAQGGLGMLRVLRADSLSSKIQTYLNNR
tara:strand:- start:199 stop:1302 length:1104 start_codon:yes stop_codon:yes gene_type:complete